MAGRIATEREAYVAAWEAWHGWGRAAGQVRAALAAYDAGGSYPLGLRPPDHPEWGWLLRRPGRVLATLGLT